MFSPWSHLSVFAPVCSLWLWKRPCPKAAWGGWCLFGLPGYSPSSEKSKQELKQRPRSKAACWLTQAAFLYTPGSLLRDSTSQGGLGSSVSVSQEDAPQAWLQASLKGHVFSWDSCFSDYSRMCQFDKPASNSLQSNALCALSACLLMKHPSLISVSWAPIIDQDQSGHSWTIQVGIVSPKPYLYTKHRNGASIMVLGPL